MWGNKCEKGKYLSKHLLGRLRGSLSALQPRLSPSFGNPTLVNGEEGIEKKERCLSVTTFSILSLSLCRVTVEIARGTPHGRDRDRWGSGGGSSRRGRSGSRERPVWLDKYGPPTRTDYKVIVENLSSRVSWQVSHTSSWHFPLQCVLF